MHVVAIATYPIKGCYRVESDRAEVQPWGLAGDRRWLIVDRETGKAVSQRDLPRLTQVPPALVPRGLVLRRAGPPHLTVPEPAAPELVEVNLWRLTRPAAGGGPA